MTSWIPCGICHESGQRWVYYDDPDNISDSDEQVRCETCSGLGELPSDGLIEAAAIAAAETKLPDSKKYGPLPAVTWDGLHPGQQVIQKLWARAALVAARLFEQSVLRVEEGDNK